MYKDSKDRGRCPHPTAFLKKSCAKKLCAKLRFAEEVREVFGRDVESYDKENKKPVIRCSICTGEQSAGFKDIHTGKFEEIMLIRNESDLNNFKRTYGITGDISKIY